MNIPKTVRILGRTYEVEHINIEKEKDNDGHRGYVNYPNQRIIIDNSGHRERQESTLLHEIIHVIATIQSVDLKEKDVELIEAGLYQVIKDNPGIFEGDIIRYV